MNWKLYFKHRKNKIFATGLSGIALAILLAYHIGGVIIYGSAYFDFATIWNAALTLIVYGIIFVCNIRNDNLAYSGILAFVFFITFDHIYSLLMSGYNFAALFSSGAPAAIIAFIVTLLFNVAMVVSGVILYIRIRRYMIGLYSDFRKIRTLGIIFAGLLLIAVSVEVALFIMIGLFEPGFMWMLFAEPVSEVVMAAAVCFTLERLRRI